MVGEFRLRWGPTASLVLTLSVRCIPSLCGNLVRRTGRGAVRRCALELPSFGRRVPCGWRASQVPPAEWRQGFSVDHTLRGRRTLGAAPAVGLRPGAALCGVGLMGNSTVSLKFCAEGRSYIKCSYHSNNKFGGKE